MIWVSIPIGFSQALQPNIGRRFGVGVRKVSIPIGFSQALQRCWLALIGKEILVSIPIGFSQALQQGAPHKTLFFAHSEFQSLSGFLRPCNLHVLPANAGSAWFQSLSGFLRPCNLWPVTVRYRPLS